MGWEQRGSNRYYYRKERQGERIRSIYVGRGGIAEMIASLQTHSPALERLAHAIKSPEQLKFEQCEAALNGATSLLTMVVRGALLAGGFHTHNRQWRRIRNGSS